MLRKSDNPPARYPEGRDLSHEDAPWAAVYVKSRQEKALARDLIRLDIPYYLPLITHTTRRRDNNKPRKTILPLFPGYMAFAAPPDRWDDVYQTHRISTLIPVHDQQQFVKELQQVQRVLESNLEVNLAPTYSPGERVRVKEGALQGLNGSVARAKGKTLFLINVTMFQQAVQVEVDEMDLEKV